MSLKFFYEWVERRNVSFLWFCGILVVLTLLGATGLVYATGGSFVVYTHSMYIPIVIAALVFGWRGGLLVAVLAGLLLGPLMPMDVATGEPQSLFNWTFRLFYFLLVALIVGGSAELIGDYISQVRWRLNHNEASDLPNRKSLKAAINTALVIAPPGQQAALLYLIDISNLNELSLKLGAGFEQAAISSLSKLLAQNADQTLALFQVRTDRLAILVREPELEAAVNSAIERSVNTPVLFEGIPLLLHCVWSDIPIDDAVAASDDYLRKLEMALNEARVRKLQHFRYSEALERFAKQNVEILGLLKQALDANALELQYQPKYRLNDRSLHSVETLLVWNDPERGKLQPSEFIPLAENSILITPMTLWVIEKAVADFSAWRKQGYSLHSIAVNISSACLASPDFVAGVRGILERYAPDGVAGEPGWLELELTESSMVADLDVAVRTLNEVSDLGVHISVDDFGTGFSSLQYLDRLPVHSIKIDQSFIRSMLSKDSNRSIVESTIDLGHRLGFQVVAEGIESEEIEQALADMGCDYGQGYYFARPLSESRLREFFQEQVAV